MKGSKQVNKMTTKYEKEIIAKWNKARTQWWLLSPKELRDLEKEVEKIYIKERTLKEEDIKYEEK